MILNSWTGRRKCISVFAHQPRQQCIYKLICTFPDDLCGIACTQARSQVAYLSQRIPALAGSCDGWQVWGCVWVLLPIYVDVHYHHYHSYHWYYHYHAWQSFVKPLACLLKLLHWVHYESCIDLVVEKTISKVISSVHMPWWYLYAYPASIPSLLKITYFTMVYACMLWLMHCGKKFEFEIESKFVIFVLFSAPSKWNVLFCITEIGAHKLRLHVPFTMGIIKGWLLFDAFSDVYMSCICFANTVNICGNKHIFIVIVIFSPCELEIWWMTPKNNRAPLLYNTKLCASFQIHPWIHTWATVWKRPIWVKFDYFFSRVTSKFDGWP